MPSSVDRRTAEFCAKLRKAGRSAFVRRKTGLVLDPYFPAPSPLASGSQLRGAGPARRGELAFGTVDSFLLWRLTGGAEHATDPSNASRTMLMDLKSLR